MVRKLKAKKRTLLVDGDIVCYRIATGIEEATEWEDDMWTLHSDAKLGKEILDTSLNRYLKELNCNNIVIALSDNFLGLFLYGFIELISACSISILNYRSDYCHTWIYICFTTRYTKQQYYNY